MFSRKELYYQGSAAGEAYTNSPGILQVNRLLNQQSGIFLQNNASLLAMRKRKIIINDWGDELRISDSLLWSHIALLLDEGFSVYQVQGDMLAPIHNSHDLKPLPSNVLAERDLYKLLNDNKLEKDTVYILSHDIIEKLCRGAKEPRNTFFYTSSEHLSAENKAMREATNENLLSFEFRATWDETNREMIRRLDIVGRNYTLERVLKYCKLDNLTTLEIYEIIFEKMESLLSLTPNINTLIYSNSKNNQSFKSLGILPQLKKLKLLGTPLDWENDSTVLPNVNWLTIKGQTIDAVNFENMLQRMPNLEALELIDVNIVGEFKNLNNTTLKVLHYSSNGVINSNTKAMLSSLVNHSPSLVSLTIDSKCVAENGWCFKPSQSLRLLSLQNIIINAEDLQALLSEQLVQLHLKNITLEGDIHLIQPLQHLAELKIEESASVSEKSCMHCIEMAPKLKSITVNNVQFSVTTAIKLLQYLHDTKLDADIKMPSLFESISYQQVYPQKDKPIHALIANDFSRGFNIPIIKACSWVKTIQIENKVTISRDITGEDLCFLLQKLPTDNYFELALQQLNILGELKAFPTIRVKSLSMMDMVLSASQLDILKQCIKTDELHVWKVEVLSSPESNFYWKVNKVISCQSSWNSGLFSLLKPNYLKLEEINDETFEANEWVSTLECALEREGVDQHILNAINTNFLYLNHLIINEVQFENFKSPTTNRFNVKQLTFNSFKLNKNSTMLEFIKQFPKIEELVILSRFSRRLLLDFKQYCPDLKKITFNAMTIKLEDLMYIVRALPKGCEVVFHRDCWFRGDKKELELFLSKHPQVHLSTQWIRHPKNNKSPSSDFKPYTPTATTLDPSWSQGMLINRLIAYQTFSLPDKDIESYTELVKKGICQAVAKRFADTVENEGLESWNNEWQLIKSWDKKSSPLKESALGQALEKLKDYVSRYQLQELSLGSLWDRLQSQIITNDLSQFLELPPKSPVFLDNSWHRTCLIYKENQWIYFDPNYKLGEPRHFSSKEEAVEEIERVLGQGLQITSFDESLNPCWNPSHDAINPFLETGGFGLILKNKGEMNKIKNTMLNRPALEGLFLLDMGNIPFWYYGLRQKSSIFTGNEIQKQTLSLFESCAQRISKDALMQKINNGMGYLNDEKRKILEDALSQCEDFPDLVKEILLSISETPLPNVTKGLTWLPERLERPELIIEPQSASETVVESETLISKKSVKVKKDAPLIEEKPLVYLSPNDPGPVVLNHPFILNLALADYQKNPIIPLKSNHFTTWVADKKDAFETLNAFDNSLFSSQNLSKNLLVHIPDDNQLVNYMHHLQASQSVSARGLFVVNSFDELHCALSTVTVDFSGKGVIKPPNSGPLYDFLIEHAQGAPIIAVNWSNFTSQQVIQANTLLDKSRHVDKVSIPKNAIVLGLQNPQDPNAYLGSDFSSRHFKLIDFPNVSIPKVELPKLDEQTVATECVLDLFGDSNWEAFFYGQWRLTEEGLFFEKSDLLKALDNKPEALQLVIKNAPFHNPSFAFAFNSLLSKGYCTVNGARFELPKNIGVALETGYDFEDLFAHTIIHTKRGYLSEDDDFVLNSGNLASFFENYKINPDTHALITLPGLLEKHANQTVSLCLTSSISLASFARLLQTAKTHNTQIKLKVAPGVIFPEEIARFLTENEPLAVSEASSTRLIVSNDISSTEKMLQKEQSIDLSIDISEETKDSLLYALSGKFSGDKPLFNETISDVWQALMNKKKVLLKGHFSPELVDALAALFKPGGGIYHNGQWEMPTGELIVLTDTAESFSFVSQVEKKEVHLENKMSLLDAEQRTRLLKKYSEKSLSTFSYAYLLALSLAKELPDKPEDLTKPLRELPDLLQIDDDYGLEEGKSNAFKDSRRSALLEALEFQPTVFLSGETGVGKSSFMHDLEKEPLTQVSFGDIDAWLQASSLNKHNILFMDESNLTNTDWLCFEGLYASPPSIFYKGTYYPLSDTHKVVFAGNPSSYSQARNLPELFQNHPNVVTFGAMNNAYLYHEVLKPILKNNEDAQLVARIFLKTFQTVKTLAKEAISARELQMMAYLFQAQHLPADARERAKVVAFTMACQVLPPKLNAQFKTLFAQEFGALQPELEAVPTSIGRVSPKSLVTDEKKMLVTPSHHTVYRWLKSFMDVRTQKQQGQGKACYGGLSGLTIEGEPGVGKSYFVKEFLLELGFSEKKINDEGLFTPFDYDTFKQSDSKSSSHFYYLPANLDPSVKIDVLNRAFHEGAVVIVDEINASSLLEELTNALLMGEDLKGRRALTPGFSLIGTQNPSSMQGRAQASLASDRRVIRCDFPTYTPAEMVQVVMHKGVDEAKAYSLVYDFLTKQHYARKHNLHPEPCFRDLLKEVKSYKKGLKEDTLSKAPIIELPFAETVLLRILNLDNLEHQDLIMQLRKIGYEKFFYKGEDDALYVIPTTQSDVKLNVSDTHNVAHLVSYLKEAIKRLSFKDRIIIGNEALNKALTEVPLEDLALFLKTASFKKIDYLQLSLDLMQLDKARFNIVGKTFTQFCNQVDAKTSTNNQYCDAIATYHPKSEHYSKNRFFSTAVDKEKEQQLPMHKPGNQ